MSLRKKVLIIVLGSALAVLVGRSLTTATMQQVVNAAASAVWGS